MNKILVVEDSKMFGKMVKNKLETELNTPVIWAKSLAETIKVLNSDENIFSSALLDFNLPDAPSGEIIDTIVQKGIPSIVFTANISKETRDFVWSKKVVDYIIKDDPNSLEYIITALKKLSTNHNSKILVVDDSTFFLRVISELLEIQKFTVLNAGNGEKALEIFKDNPDIKLVITDFNMPKMDGFALCRSLRQKYSKDELGIIGISSEKDKSLGAGFIKNGANDFIVKQSFIVEEFYCRIHNCIDNIDLIKQAKEASIKDYLTGLYNRRYLFNVGDKFFENAKRENISLICAMLDIDFFKKVNDTYGHDAGDIVIKKIAQILQSRLRKSDIVSRIGGEEFCILAINMKNSEAYKTFENIRKLIEASSCYYENKKINVTVSIGICCKQLQSLEEMITIADKQLYSAKNTGRNKVCN